MIMDLFVSVLVIWAVLLGSLCVYVGLVYALAARKEKSEKRRQVIDGERMTSNVIPPSDYSTAMSVPSQRTSSRSEA